VKLSPTLSRGARPCAEFRRMAARLSRVPDTPDENLEPQGVAALAITASNL
jgi:hypothetical protein